MTKTLVYKAEEIFEDIDGDNENVLMNIPPEVAEKAGFKPGDTLKIEKHPAGGISITKVKDGEG
jgi:hypothetical protein